MSNNLPMPEGLAFYFRDMKRQYGTPTELAAKLVQNGISWVAIGGPCHLRNRSIMFNKPDTVKRYSEAFKAAGLVIHVWGYPWWDRIDRYIKEMKDCTDLSLVSGWLHNPELGLKKHPDQARQMMEETREYNPYMIVGLSTYGFIQYHRTFPLEEFYGVEYVSPQLYDLDLRKINIGLSQWAKQGFTDNVIPSPGCFKWYKKDPSKPLKGRNKRARGMTNPELNAHLNAFIHCSTPHGAAVVWDYKWIRRQAWPSIKMYAEWLAQGKTPVECPT